MTSGFKTVVFALCVGVAACGSSNNTGGGITITDGGSDGSTSGNDGSTSGNDGSTSGNDGSAPGNDGSASGNDASADRPATTDGSTSMYGRCGQTVVQALCACGPMDAACQGRALQTNMTCLQCYAQAIQGCCPMQTMELSACGMRMMCQTDACLQSMCRMEYAALNTCFASAQQNDMACQRLMAACFGTFPPACM